MTALIYIICFFCAAIFQALFRLLLRNGSISFIPGSVIFYLFALWIARRLSNSYKERKEIKDIQKILMSQSSKITSGSKEKKEV